MAEKKENKLSYDKLNEIANKAVSELQVVTAQNQRLVAQVKELSALVEFKGLDYAFRVLEYADKFPTEFVEITVGKIINAMTVEEANQENKEETDGEKSN